MYPKLGSSKVSDQTSRKTPGNMETQNFFQRGRDRARAVGSNTKNGNAKVSHVHSSWKPYYPPKAQHSILTTPNRMSRFNPSPLCVSEGVPRKKSRVERVRLKRVSSQLMRLLKKIPFMSTAELVKAEVVVSSLLHGVGATCTSPPTESTRAPGQHEKQHSKQPGAADTTAMATTAGPGAAVTTAGMPAAVLVPAGGPAATSPTENDDGEIMLPATSMLPPTTTTTTPPLSSLASPDIMLNDTVDMDVSPKKRGREQQKNMRKRRLRLDPGVSAVDPPEEEEEWGSDVSDPTPRAQRTAKHHRKLLDREVANMKDCRVFGFPTVGGIERRDEEPMTSASYV